ncbi:MAG TPA: energy transducer TonB [Gemmatimonadales bacterium]|nr:energy transducer TonB [Gemmatimonadales bacterium]
MLSTPLESSRSFLRSAECSAVSVLAHLGAIWMAVAVTHGSPQLPSDEREARVFFLLPPDRMDVRAHQSETVQWGRPGADLEDGENLTRPGEGLRLRERAYGARPAGEESGARGELPFGPPPDALPDTVWSVLDVDEAVERYDGSAAPAYPPDLLAIGAEGVVQALYIVDTAGAVDTSSVEVVYSDDPRFTQSVRTALGGMRFRPARRNGSAVRQRVLQQFRFKIVPPSILAKQPPQPG